MATNVLAAIARDSKRIRNGKYTLSKCNDVIKSNTISVKALEKKKEKRNSRPRDDGEESARGMALRLGRRRSRTAAVPLAILSGGRPDRRRRRQR